VVLLAMSFRVLLSLASFLGTNKSNRVHRKAHSSLVSYPILELKEANRSYRSRLRHGLRKSRF
jgi:hypothetical protein